MKFPRLRPFLLLTAIVVACALCVSGQGKPDSPKPGSDATSTVPKALEGVGAAVDPNKYLIGPEDVLFIKTWREQDFSMPVAVRPDGKITMPLVGDIPASGLTPLQLTADIKERLGKYINNPDVTVMVTEVRSKKYYMDGEVNHTGAFPLVTPIKVYEAISMAGGFREFANKKKITIIRGSKIFKFNYVEFTRGKRPEQNIQIENGDHIEVP